MQEERAMVVPQSQQVPSTLTPEEYLAFQRAPETQTRFEYVQGEIIAMGGASRRHSLIAGNIFRELGNQLEGRPCEAHITNLRVGVVPRGIYTYPDVVVVCSEPRFEDRELDTLLNPTLIVEGALALHPGLRPGTQVRLLASEGVAARVSAGGAGRLPGRAVRAAV